MKNIAKIATLAGASLAIVGLAACNHRTGPEVGVDKPTRVDSAATTMTEANTANTAPVAAAATSTRSPIATGVRAPTSTGATAEVQRKAGSDSRMDSFSSDHAKRSDANTPPGP